MPVVLLILSLLFCSVGALYYCRRHGMGLRSHVSMHPQEASWLRSLGLCEAGDFFDLASVIVSGHPDRHVGRIELGGRVFYLKREHQIFTLTRLVNFLRGYGWSARCVREAIILEALERDQLPGPRWIATGEDDQGRAFLLVEEVSGAVALATALEEMTDARSRRETARRMGRALARLHAAGFFHRDLYAKHVLLREEEIYLLDWQRARLGAWISRRAAIRDLAALHATLAEGLVGPRERIVCLLAYLEGRGETKAQWRNFATAVDQMACRMRQRRHIREKRQRPTTASQSWICLDGEALCVTPALQERRPTDSFDWLRLEHQPAGPVGVPLTRRWIELQEGRLGLFTQRRGELSWLEFVRRWVFRKSCPSPEQRQATLLWRLERHGVGIPTILAVGRRWVTSRRFESFLLLEPIRGVRSLSVWLRRASGEPLTDILRQLGRLLARMHGACCYFEEGGLKGLSVILGPTPRLVLLGVDGITPLRRPSATRARQDLFLVKMFLGGQESQGWTEVLRGHSGEEPAERQPLEIADEKHGRNVSGANGTSPPPVWVRFFRGWRRIFQRPDWVFYAGTDWTERIMQVSVTDQFHAKQGRSTGRWVLSAPDGSGQNLSVFLKRHYQVPLIDRLRALIWPRGNWSPAMMEYEHLEWARKQGVPVPATVAAAEFLAPGGGLQSFLAVEELTGMLPLHEAIPQAKANLSPGDFRRWKAGLVAEIARITRLLHDRKHYHKDLYLCHFFIPEVATKSGSAETGALASFWRGRVFLIDLHRLTHHPITWPVWLLKDLAQLLYSSELDGVDARDQLAFWRHYRGPGSQRWTYRILRWVVLLKWRRYRSHNERMQKRRQRKGDGVA